MEYSIDDYLDIIEMCHGLGDSIKWHYHFLSHLGLNVGHLNPALDM